jgi:hypothetical protein
MFADCKILRKKSIVTIGVVSATKGYSYYSRGFCRDGYSYYTRLICREKYSYYTGHFCKKLVAENPGIVTRQLLAENPGIVTRQLLAETPCIVPILFLLFIMYFIIGLYSALKKVIPVYIFCIVAINVMLLCIAYMRVSR